MFSMLFVVLVLIGAGVVNADQLTIQPLPDISKQPTKIVYESYFPLNFAVTLTNDYADPNDKCIGVPGAQFAIIAVYGKTNGINIVPSFESGRGEKVTIDIDFISDGIKVDNVTFTNVHFDGSKNPAFEITVDYNVLTVLSSSKYPYAKAFDSSLFPDFIDKKYLSLSFFQPLQIAPPNGPVTSGDFTSDVNKCRFVLDYNGKYVWRPGQPFEYGRK